MLKISEHQIQCAVKEFSELYQLPMFSIPNEGQRSVGMAYKLKKSGMLPGVSDLFFMRGNAEHKGLFIELKVPGNKPTQLQLNFIALANAEGYKALVCYGLNDAISTIKDFYQL